MMATPVVRFVCVTIGPLVGLVVLVFLTIFAATGGEAQTTTPGPAIDVEIYNPVDGTNTFCVAPGEYFEAHVWVSPGT
ncbi:MAG: hypothetical protein K8R59_18280, partial [Thermoanaerobaculales bacterium]|nr:hypothetical protein [Thermoanaerobaculales bacterium]